MRTGRPPKPLLDRFASSIQLDEQTNCWNWIGSRDRFGYGVIVERFGPYDKRQLKAHRLAYEFFVDDIPQAGPKWSANEITIDHLCFNPSCVNPKHLRLLMRGENSSGSRWNKAKRAITHCPKGHPYDAENTYIRKFKNGRTGRTCKTCSRLSCVASYHKKMSNQSFHCVDSTPGQPKKPGVD